MDLLERVQLGFSHLELFHIPHEAWPLPVSRAVSLVHPVRILVLDSSFNPPTLAHLALAQFCHHSLPNYDAKLLLLSVRNADKSLKPHDASYLQRLDMMSLLSREMASKSGSSHVAIAITDQATFVGKSRCLRSFFKDRASAFATTSGSSLAYDTEITFLLGLDTLERLMHPRYYSSQLDMIRSIRKFLSPPPGDNCYIACARRNFSVNMATTESDPLLQEFIRSGRIIIFDIDQNLAACSSTDVRERIAIGGAHSLGWRNFVTARIAEYIAVHGLYQGLCPD